MDNVAKAVSDVLRRIVKAGVRECTFQYDDGRFVIHDLSEFDELIDKIKSDYKVKE